MNKILEVRFGSHLYGTNTENSDLDLKSIYIPTGREIVLGSYKPTINTSRPKQFLERNHKDDVDLEIFSLDRWLQLLSEGQVVALDMLFAKDTDFTYINKDNFYIFEELYKNRDKVLSKKTNAFFGYAKQQAAKYGAKGWRVAALRETLIWLDGFKDYERLASYSEFIIEWVNKTKNEHIKIVECKAPNNTTCLHLEVCNRKYPFHATFKYVQSHVQKLFDEYGQRALMAERNEGIDWKALSHAVRVNTEAKELLLTKFITFPRPDRQLLLDIKQGKLPYAEVALIIEKGLEDLLTAQGLSTLQEQPDQEWIDQFIYEVYKDEVCRIPRG